MEHKKMHLFGISVYKSTVQEHSSVRPSEHDGYALGVLWPALPRAALGHFALISKPLCSAIGSRLCPIDSQRDRERGLALECLPV